MSRSAEEPPSIPPEFDEPPLGCRWRLSGGTTSGPNGVRCSPVLRTTASLSNPAPTLLHQPVSEFFGIVVTDKLRDEVFNKQERGQP